MPDLSSTRVDTNDPAAVRRALAEYLPMDTNILNDLQSDIALWPYVFDASIVDANGKVLLHTTPQLVGKPAVERPDFSRGQGGSLPPCSSASRMVRRPSMT